MVLEWYSRYWNGNAGTGWYAPCTGMVLELPQVLEWSGQELINFLTPAGGGMQGVSVDRTRVRESASISWLGH